MASVDKFWRIYHNITKHNLNGSVRPGYRKFRAYFGTSPLACVVAWDLLFDDRPPKSTSEPLLWALMLLKRYHIESVNATLASVSEKNFQKAVSYLH